MTFHHCTELGDLHTLETLNVFGNKISRLPIKMGNCDALKNLNMGKNPLTPLSPEARALVCDEFVGLRLACLCFDATQR